jgi:hypothetical protein
LLSNEAVSLILNNTHPVKAFNLEDALYTGVIAARTGIYRVEAWYHFRKGEKVQLHHSNIRILFSILSIFSLLQLYSREKCWVDDDTPLVIAIFGQFSPADFHRKYEDLKNVQCDHLTALNHF